MFNSTWYGFDRALGLLTWNETPHIEVGIMNP